MRKQPVRAARLISYRRGTTCPPFITNFTRSSLGNVFQGIPGNCDDVRNFPFSIEPTILPSHHFRRYGGRGLDGLARRHSLFDQVDKFSGLRAMGKRADTAFPKEILTPREIAIRSAFFTQRLQLYFPPVDLGIARGVVAERIVICQ